MTVLRLPALLALALVCTTIQPARSNDLRAGFASVEITPTLGFRMSGYFYERPNTGVKDLLYVHTVYLEQDGVRAAIAVCDLIAIYPELGSAVRIAVEEQLQIPRGHVVVSATHTHTGPLYAGVLRDYFHDLAEARNGRDDLEGLDYHTQVSGRIVKSVRLAMNNAAPVVLGTGYVEEHRISFNRRFHMRDGSVRFNPGILNPDIVRPAGPIDPQVGLVQFLDASNQSPVGLLASFALHLDTVGGTLYSADYPKILHDRLREQYGERFVSLFATGTCGDINHVDVSTRTVRKTEEIGGLLTDTIVAQLPKLHPRLRSQLGVRSATVNAPLQVYTPARIDQAKRDMVRVGGTEATFLEQVETVKILDVARRDSQTSPLEVQVIRLTADTAVVALPGEVFVELGLAIKERSPFATTLVMELANDVPAYIPTRKAFAEGSYETVNSLIQPGGGEMMVEKAVELLQQLAIPGSR